MALVTLAEVKAFLGVTGTARDAQYTALIPAAEAAAEKFCRREFTSGTKIEYLSGNNTQKLRLLHFPVTSITDVRLDSSGAYGDRAGSFGSDTVLTPGVDYALVQEGSVGGQKSEAGILVRLNGVWPTHSRHSTWGQLAVESGPIYGNVRVDYAFGFASTPSDLKLAIAMMIEWVRLNPFGAGVSSEKLGDYAVTYVIGALLKYPEMMSARGILTQYRDPVL